MSDSITNEALKQLAEAASPGPWGMSGGRHDLYDGKRPVNGHGIYFGEQQLVFAHVFYDKRTGEGFADAKYIAAANPQKVLDLLSEIEAKDAEIERLSGRVPEKLGNTPTPALLATAADMLDEMAQRLGGLAGTPVVAAKLRQLRAALTEES